MWQAHVWRSDGVEGVLGDGGVVEGGGRRLLALVWLKVRLKLEIKLQMCAFPAWHFRLRQASFPVAQSL
jgi:hypothetical protein